MTSSKVIDDKKKELRRSSDHETLLKDFDSTRDVAATTKFGALPLLNFNSSIVKQYVTNKDRSLIPVANTERSLVPYSDKCMPIYSIASSAQVWKFYATRILKEFRF